MNVVQSAHSSPTAVMSIICQFKQFPCSRVAAVRTPLLKAEMHFGASHAAAEPDRAALQAQHFNFPK